MLAKTHVPFAALTTVAAAPIVGQAVGQPFTPETLLIAVAVGSIAGMLPDIDHPGALLSGGKIFPNARSIPKPIRPLMMAFGFFLSMPPRFLGYFVRGVFGHRGGTHSLVFLLLWALLAAPIYAGFVFGLAWLASAILAPTPLAFNPGGTWDFFMANADVIMPVAIIAIALGYFSHLLSDSFNTVPVPWLWPFVDKRFFLLYPPFLRITVGTSSEWAFRMITLVLLAYFLIVNIALPGYHDIQEGTRTLLSGIGG